MIKTVICFLCFALLIIYSQAEDATTENQIIEGQTTEKTPETTQSSQNNTNNVVIEKVSNSIRCVKKCDTGVDCTKENLTVIWSLENKTEITKPIEISFDGTSKSYVAELPIDTWTAYLNKRVSCAMGDLKSSLYYLGLIFKYTDANDKGKEIDIDSADNSISITESIRTDTKLEIISNVPLICSNPKADCTFEVTLMSEMKNFLRVKTDINTDRMSCKLLLNETIMWASWIIVPTVNVKNTLLANKIFNVTFNVMPGTGLNPNFKNLKLPIIKVNYAPKNERSYTSGGSCYNDPHCSTNDGSPLEFQYKDGEYLLYENKEFQYRVHMISEACIPGCRFCNYCIKSLYIQSIDEFVSFEVKRTPQFLYADLSTNDKTQVPLIWNGNSANIPKTSSGLQIHKDEYQYYIISHYGTAVTIAKYGHFIQITPSKLEKGKVYGLLGDYDSNRGNDFKLDRDGKELNFTGLNETASLDKFIESYRVSDVQQLSSGKYYSIEKDKTMLKYCECDASPVCYDSLTPVDTASKVVKRETKDVPIKPDLSQIIGFNISELLKEPPSQPSDKSTCESLKTNSMLKKCHDEGIININTLFDDCENDFKATNLTIWTEYYIQTRRGWCKTVLEDDSKFYSKDTSGNAVGKKTEIIKQLCKNDCSSKGTCNDNGKCECKTGFTGDDCSIDMTKAPQLLGALYKKNTCDRNNKQQSCNSIALLVKDLILSDKFKVIYKPENADASNLAVVPVSDLIVATVLPNETVNPNKISVKKLTISVTNDISSKSLTSNTIEFIIYNSICHELTDESKGEYSMKAGFCDINNYCYKDDEKNPLDNKLSCISKQNQFNWSSFAFRLNKNLQLIIISMLLSTITIVLI